MVTQQRDDNKLTCYLTHPIVDLDVTRRVIELIFPLQVPVEAHHRHY